MEIKNKQTKKPKRKTKKEKERGVLDKRGIAYVIKDIYFPDFEVKKSANAWWIDMRKVERLIEAYKIQCTDEEASAYAGISIAQLRYFRENHDDFYQVKEACLSINFMKARQSISNNLSNPEFALKFMERKKKEEFGLRKELIGVNGGPIETLDYEEKLRLAREQIKKDDERRGE